MIKLLGRYLKAFFLVNSVFLGGLYIGHDLIDVALAEKIDPYTSLRELATILHRVQNDYIKEEPTEDLVSASIKGMISSLDEHSHYFSENDVPKKERKNEWSIGAGMEINSEHIITRVFPKGPAAFAGLSVGDQLQSINGQKTNTWTVSKIKKQFQGNIGDKIELVVLHQKELSEHTLILDEIKIINLELTPIEPGYAYVRLEKFSTNTGIELQEELRRFQKQDGEKLKGILLDLRNNPGGGIAEGIQILDLFISEGPLASVHYRDTSQNQSYSAVQKPSDFVSPKMVVLVNELSASAAELVAGSLQYHKRAIVVGQPTFGKGSVQKIYQLEKSTLKLTVGTYILPDGRNITKKNPIQPDIKIALPALRPKQDLAQKIAELDISKENKEELLRLLSQLPENQYRPAIIWHKDFQQRCLIDPQLAAAWTNLSSK